MIGTAINGGSLEDALKEGFKTAFLDTIAAQGAFGIGSNIEPGSVANALAHAIAGCAVGAARTGGSCTAGALGAAVGELAASLYDPGALNTQGDTVQFAAMMGSIAGAIAGLDAAEINQASQAGANSAANNWLATKQVEQAKKELAEAKSPLEALQVAAKWAAVGVKQDVLTTSGIGLGLAESGISDIKGLGEFLAHPIDGLNGIREIIRRPEAREQLGDSVFKELNAKIDRMQTALTDGGDQNAVQLGQDLGSLIWQAGSVLTGAGAVAKGGVALANVAVKVGTGALDAALAVKIADAAATLRTVIEPKIVQQMGSRGWSSDAIDAVIAKPAKTIETRDTRFDPISGTRLNDPATGYIAADGSYVVRNDRTGAVVQVSNKNDPTWKAPWDK